MLAEFLVAAEATLGRPPTPEQRDAITADQHVSLFLVAGPGSGKTTVLALRTLKLILVDEVDPSGIILTTFTKRAAKELRSRVLGWGDQIRRHLLAGPLAAPIAARVARTDFNALLTGTLDSLCETVLGQYRLPGASAPVVIEDFVAHNLLLRHGLFPSGRFRDADLGSYAASIRGRPGLNARDLTRLLQALYDRSIHDDVDMGSWSSTGRPCPVCGTHPHPGVPVAADVLSDYEAHLSGAGLVDYANLERLFASAIDTGIPQFGDTVRQVLVDEYQDTNRLQEEIYFSLGRLAVAAGGALSVVGDDDQSLYRFRGATVDLFQAFPIRTATGTGAATRTIYLTDNFRSTVPVVNFVNEFADLDAGYQAARAAGKPRIAPGRAGAGDTPILGMFRPTIPTLAADLAALVSDVFQGPGRRLPNGELLERDPSGSLQDVALLTYSPGEQSSAGSPRLPGLLRQSLLGLPTPIEVFNPRGQPLRQADSVALLCGLLLKCIDPNGAHQSALGRMLPATVAALNSWRSRAQSALTTAGAPPDLVRYVQGFAARPRPASWPREVGVSDITYKLVSWIPSMQDDPEDVCRLEVIQRAIVEAARFTGFGGTLVFQPGLEEASAKEAIRSIFGSIAEGAVEIDEDLLDTLPADRLNILSIHQAKGLQFPLTIVDVGSAFATRHHQQAMFRFPRNGNDTHQLEDELRPHSRSLTPPTRSQLDRAFDDLVRTYFVAFSRAQDVLLLVGNSRLLTDTPSPVENVATGWSRDGAWAWGAGLPNLLHL